MKRRTKLNPYASTSNKDKQRKKNFMMMKHSQNVRTKGKRSFRDKQVHIQLLKPNVSEATLRTGSFGVVTTEVMKENECVHLWYTLERSREVVCV